MAARYLISVRAGVKWVRPMAVRVLITTLVVVWGLKAVLISDGMALSYSYLKVSSHDGFSAMDSQVLLTAISKLLTFISTSEPLSNRQAL